MEYFTNIFCVSKPDLTNGDPRSLSVKERPVMGEEALHKYLVRNPQVRVRNGGGPGRPALLNYQRLRSDIKAKLIEKYGPMEKFMQRNLLAEMIEPDFKANLYFSAYLLDDDKQLKPEVQSEYNTNAMVLNAVGRYVADFRGSARAISKKATGVWEKVSEAVNALDPIRFPHSLPTNPVRLKGKYQEYMENGYLALIHRNYCNNNARKVDAQIEKLIVSLYCQQNLPFGSWVYDDYMQFLAGKLQIVDVQTGELYDREDFFDHEKGAYTTISRSTVWNIVNNPRNAMVISKFRNNRIDHVTRMTPMNQRKAPVYSLSKITMDDRDLPRKTSDGKWVHTYMAFDVASQAVISCVYSLEKPDHAMVWNCFRELYRTIDTNRLAWPGQVEVENHLMKEISDELHAMFAAVTFCDPGMPQSKRAEHFIHFMKYHVEKRRHKGIGRHHQKKAYKTLKAGKGEEYEQEHLPLETLIADCREDIHAYNHMLHPNQKLYPGKTRWQVLTGNQHPDLERPRKENLFRFLGLKTETSIRNNDFAQVQYARYLIDNLGAIGRLKPNNYSVDARYVPDADGNIGEVYLYQGDTFITRAVKGEQYNEAVIERTADDERIRTEQSKRKAHYFKVQREGIEQKVVRRLDISRPVDLDSIAPEVIVVPEPEPVEQNLDELISEYSQLNYREIGIQTS